MERGGRKIVWRKGERGEEDGERERERRGVSKRLLKRM